MSTTPSPISSHPTPTPTPALTPPLPFDSDSSSWQLISQGAEARIWFIPNFFTLSESDPISHPSSSSSSSSPSTQPIQAIPAICKERFPKSYRHSQLDSVLTKARTKAEARNLVKCQKVGIGTPTVYAVHLPKQRSDLLPQGPQLEVDGDLNSTLTCLLPSASSHSSSSFSSSSLLSSCCLFLEYIQGCTLREFFEKERLTVTTSNNMEDEDDINDTDELHDNSHGEEIQEEEEDDHEYEYEYEPHKKMKRTSSTELDSNRILMKVAYEIGALIAKMHLANIIHGDLTTSNILIRNPLYSKADDTQDTTATSFSLDWKPQLVLIDLGLSTTCTPPPTLSPSKKIVASAGRGKNPTSHHNGPIGGGNSSSFEEKAVDLYVLERAFLTTHLHSEELVTEILRAYQVTTNQESGFHTFAASCTVTGTNRSHDPSATKNHDTIHGSQGMGDLILKKLQQVRLRGRKRECFG